MLLKNNLVKVSSAQRNRAFSAWWNFLSKPVVTATALVAVSACSAPLLQPNDSDLRSPAVEVPETNISIDKKAALESHNFVRSKLGVPSLQWSNRLEALAANWANYLTTDAGCTSRRRGLIGLTQHKNGVGENILFIEPKIWSDGRRAVAEIDERETVLNWARQSVDYDYKENKCAAGKVCENYTQVIWRDSQVVGCAAASCEDQSQILVCNYDPPGNYFGQKPY